MNWNNIPEPKGEPDFNNLLALLECKVPQRPTLFEFALNERLYARISPGTEVTDPLAQKRRIAEAFRRLGYDYVPILLPGFSFSEDVVRRKLKTHSLNEGGIIRSRKDFEEFDWPDPGTADYALLDRLGRDLPKGMKLIPYAPDGVLENVINLMGYDTLCYALADDSQLVEDIFSSVGRRLLDYYQRVILHDCVGACFANDDWGFKSSTLLSTEDLRRFVFPWYERIVEAAHRIGKPVILHSCGYFENIIEDVIERIRFDGRHSYEDAIMPVEQAYATYKNRLAVLGGIDVDFMCRSSPEEIYGRSRRMLETAAGGGYALGTGNSVPDYLPDTHYFAMIRAALDMRS